MIMKFIEIKNNQAVFEDSVPVLEYPDFKESVLLMLDNHPERHCVSYFGYRKGNYRIKMICCIADDKEHSIYVTASEVDTGMSLKSLSSINLSFQNFEREICENFGIQYSDHPWPKPLRYPESRADKSATLITYPFFRVNSEELHEVGVGPVHAGIIEPGHFRFVCNGEQILHLEIQLGYQHRAVEQLFLEKKKLLQRTIIAESVAGDSVVEHTSAFSSLFESLAGIDVGRDVFHTRTLAQELERVAIHTGDLSAICTDVAYQLGSSVFGRLRTPIINFFQEWCGNRLAKSLIRPGYNPFPFTSSLAKRLYNVLDAFEPDFIEMSSELSKLPSSLSRFERTGANTYEQLLQTGAVGMAARANALMRDVRISHPYALYTEIEHTPVIKHHGDVYSRVQIRKEEVVQSLAYIRKLMERLPVSSSENDNKNLILRPGMLAISLAEGWRGEICHVAITGNDGELKVYKVKDPSFHNWLALALAVRNNEISDFPVCNKSFNLSYCGHDL
jgi:Ni,Fe-hydrogenase III large subunit/Ni,Fe-hydrogenase III component G